MIYSPTMTWILRRLWPSSRSLSVRLSLWCFSIKSPLFYPCCTSTGAAPVPTAVVSQKYFICGYILIVFTQTPETPFFCLFILPEHENVQYRQRSLLPRKSDSLTDFLLIADLRVTSQRPCWWSRTKAFFSSGN